MNVNEYITSGIVELYAMNALTPEEKKEFERLMILYPEIARELDVTMQTLEEYSSSHALNPRPQIRQRIMDKINEDNIEIKRPKGKIVNHDYSLTYKYMIAASLAALVVSTFASWFFYSRWNEAEERYTSLLNEKNELAQNYNLVKTTFDETISNLEIIRDEHSNVIVLNSTDTTHHYQARVYWSNYTHRSFIDVLSLPAPASGKQYQLWALVGGKPIDAGVLLTGDQNVQRMKDILLADLWAVTLEPSGGSLVPTLDQMYLISKNS